MNYKSIFRSILFIFIVVSAASCDDDANEFGANVIGDDNFLGIKDSARVTASTVDLGAVASNNLPVNPLGIYNNSVFGLTKAHFATQVQLAVENPTIDLDLNPAVVSATLTIPYFSTRTGADDNNVGLYELDSIYGPTPSGTTMKLNIYESGFYMRDLDPANNEQQLYYTDQNAEFLAAATALGPRLNTGVASQNDAFFFSNEADSETTTENGTTTTAEVGPRMNIVLDSLYFQNKLFSALSAGQLVNNNVFKNYFRGLYFNVSQNGSEPGNLAMLNFAFGKITIKYREKTSQTDETLVDKSIVLNLTGNTVSLLEQIGGPAMESNKLYLKGGQGYMATIDLFTELGDLEKLRYDNLLINDATLTFTIDTQTMSPSVGGPEEPKRIYLYDIKNKRPLVDYYSDQSVNSSKPKFSKGLHDGIIQKTSDGRGFKYRIRLTNHIRGLINNADSTNVKLGLVVTENIQVIDNRKLRNQSGVIKEVPLMSVANPFGTVIYGSEIQRGQPNYDKRLKLDIYYTKPN